MALLSIKKKNVASILAVFKKTIGELESHAHAQHETVATIDHQIKALTDERAVASYEARHAATVVERLNGLLADAG